MNTGPAKTPRLKVRLAQVGTWDTKMEWWVRMTPRDWLSAAGLNNHSCSQPGKQKLRDRRAQSGNKDWHTPIGPLTIDCLCSPDLLAGACGNEMSGILN
jgi:hypothetical protein